jgi:hypothetical protein
VLKWKGKMRKESYASPNSDGSLEEPYAKVYGLEHFVLRIIRKFKKDHKAYEPEIVFSLWGFEIILAIIVILII